MQNKKIIILIVLGIAAVFSLVYGIATPSKRRQAQGRTDQDAQVQSKAGGVPKGRHHKESEFSSWGKNPFTLIKVSVKTFQDLVLKGILWDEKNPQAIINDIIVVRGDEVGGHRVVDIKEDRVVLNDGISEFELHIEE